MRAVWVAGAAAAALMVSGCDINTTPKTAKVDCNCTVPPQTNTAATPPPDMRGSTDYDDHDRYRHRGHGGTGGHRYRYRPHGYAYHGGHEGHGSYYWRREYSELSVYTYDYHSTSTSTYVGGHSGSYGGASAEAYAAAGAGAYAGAGASTGGGYHVVPHGWTDGYGTMHTGGGAYAGAPAHYETGGRDRDRMSSWHGYDADCPDDHR